MIIINKQVIIIIRKVERLKFVDPTTTWGVYKTNELNWNEIN